LKPNIAMKNHLSKGKFIVLEGGEGCGKSSQIEILKSSLPKDQFIFTREPGGTKVADQIRNIIVTGDKDKILPETELALIYAARNEHLHRVILPALEAGKHVISDRFCLSTFVYQGAARGLSHELIASFNNIFMQNFEPDLTLIFDLDTEIAKKRVGKRNNKDERFEQFDKNFHKRIRQGFLNYAKNDPKIKVVDASKTIKQLSAQIKQELDSILNFE